MTAARFFRKDKRKQFNERAAAEAKNHIEEGNTLAGNFFEKGRDSLNMKKILRKTLTRFLLLLSVAVRLNDYHILCSVKTGYNGNIGISVLRYNRRSTLAVKEECRQETQSCQHYEADDLPDSSRKARA